MNVETPCPPVWSCQDSAIAVAAVDRFIPHVPTLARRRCQCAWAALGAGEAGPVPETTTRFLSSARFVTTASVELPPSTSLIRTMDRSGRPTSLPWRFEPDDRDLACGGCHSRGRCRPSYLPAGVSPTRALDPGRRGGAGLEWVLAGPGLLQ